MAEDDAARRGNVVTSVVEALRQRNVAIVENKDAHGEERIVVALCDDKDAQNKEHQGKRVQFEDLTGEARRPAMREGWR